MADLIKAAKAIDKHLRVEEGERLKPYLCSAGKPTIGVGATTYLDGRPVKLSDPPITVEQMNRMLEVEINRYMTEIMGMVNGEATTNQLVALVICAYNIGLEGMRTSSMIRLHKEGRYKEAAGCFRLWDKYRRHKGAPLEVHPVLHARRLREAAVYLTPEADEELAVARPPQAVEAPPSLAFSPTIGTSGVLGVSGVVATVAQIGEQANEVGTALAPVTGTLQSVKGLLTNVIGLPANFWLPAVCIIGAAVVFYRRRKQRLEGVA